MAVKIKNFFIIMAISVAIIITSYNYSNRKLANTENEKENFLGLTDKQRLEDYDYFWDFLRENFIYWGYIEKTYDTNKIYKDKREQLIKNNTDDNFIEVINSTTKKFNNIAHLNLVNESLFDNLNNSEVLKNNFKEEFNDIEKSYEKLKVYNKRFLEIDKALNKNNSNNDFNNVETKIIKKMK